MRVVRLLLSAALAATAVVALPVAAHASPVATDDAAYDRCGRVFPDPQAYGPSPSPPATSSTSAKSSRRL